MKDWNFF